MQRGRHGGKRSSATRHAGLTASRVTDYGPALPQSALARPRGILYPQHGHTHTSNPRAMSEFRFSPRPNRAGEIHWRTWGAPAFAEAAAAGRPVLLNLSAVWCHWCHLMDETTLSDPTIITLLNSELVPIRVDADRSPHVQDRYIAGGWPTNAFLTPTGEVLWAGTYLEPDEFRKVAESVLAAWGTRRAELETEIERRRR